MRQETLKTQQTGGGVPTCRYHDLFFSRIIPKPETLNFGPRQVGFGVAGLTQAFARPLSPRNPEPTHGLRV